MLALSGPWLITGAGGYLGGAVAQAFAAQGQSLRLAYRQASPSLDPSLGEWVPLALGDETSCAQAVRGASVVLHFAALGEAACRLDPLAAIQVNIAGTQMLASAAAAAGCRRFIYASTAHVYGALVGKLTEMSPCVPSHSYGYTHRAAEDVLRAHCRPGGMEGLSLRLANIFGPPLNAQSQAWKLLVNDLCYQARMQECLTLSSSGLQARNFLPMSGFLSAIDHVLRADFPATYGSVFNLGSSRSQSVLAIAEAVSMRAAKILGRALPIKKAEPKNDEIVTALEYSSTALRATGLASGTDLAEQALFMATIDDTLMQAQKLFR